MRAVRFASFGDPARVLTVENQPITAPGPGQVLLRMCVRPINPSDIFSIRGLYGILPRLPATPGMEGAGVVVTIGSGVTGFTVGQRVVPMFVGGTWQEYMVVEASSLLAIPPEIDMRQAATLVLNPASAWLLIYEVLRVEPGAWVLQNAANSAVGRLVIQLSHHAGFRTINVVRRRELVQELLDAGADAVICEADEDVPARVVSIVGPQRVRYAIDSVAGVSGSRLAQCLGSGGTLVAFGAISRQSLSIDAGALVFREASLRGWWFYHWMRSATSEQIIALFRMITPLIRDGTLHTPIAAEYHLDAIHEAIRAAEYGYRTGKILLVSA